MIGEALDLGSVAPALMLPVMATVLACCAVVCYLLAVRRQRQVWVGQVTAAGVALSPHLVAGERLSFAVLDAIEEYGRQSVMQVLRQARRRLKGRAADSVREALSAYGEVRRLQQAARSTLRSKRLYGVWGLGECGGEVALSELRSLLKHSDRQTRTLTREAMVLSGDETAVDLAIASFLEEGAATVSLDARFLDAVSERFPEKLRSAGRGQTVVSIPHQSAIDDALERASTIPDRAVMDTRALALGVDSELALDQTDLLDASPIGARAPFLDEEWPDERAPRFGLLAVLRRGVGSEVAFGLALLAASVVGGASAWLLFG